MFCSVGAWQELMSELEKGFRN